MARVSDYNEGLTVDGHKLLNKQFGGDFKEPEKTEAAKAVAPPVISTGNSV